MANVNPFSPSVGTTKTLSATNSSSSVTFDSKDVVSSTSATGTSGSTIDRGTVGGHSVIRVYNAGTATVFCRWGNGAQTATTSDMPLIPGVVEVFSKADQDNTFAGITASSTATVYITCGKSGHGISHNRRCGDWAGEQCHPALAAELFIGPDAFHGGKLYNLWYCSRWRKRYYQRIRYAAGVGLYKDYRKLGRWHRQWRTRHWYYRRRGFDLVSRLFDTAR